MIIKQKLIIQIMKKFYKFYFSNFEFNNSTMEAVFRYNFDNQVFFEEIIDFSSKNFKIRGDFDIETLNNILFHLHMALWISYYKSCPTKELIVESGYLDEYQINFWKKFYINWLWEFLYTNKINPKKLFNFFNCSRKKYIKKDFSVSNKALVATWWWKDTIVSIELLKKPWIDFDLVVFWKKDKLKKNTAKISNKKILSIKRKISENLLELNEEWYYNWHVPITWIIAFALEAASYIYDYKYIVLSNEKSADFWNIEWEWVEVNHQYSKSLEFEKDFWVYVKNYISDNTKYFSLLRWMYEVKIAELFAEYWKQYFWNFSSCNVNFKILNEKNHNKKDWKYWCNSCPKCAFVFSILRPYLKKKEVKEIFWEDLYAKKELEETFMELLWISWIKPFECVWEAEEVIYSMYKSLDKYKENKLPYILEVFKKDVLNKMKDEDLKNIEKKLVRIWWWDIIPSELKELIFKNL